MTLPLGKNIRNEVDSDRVLLKVDSSSKADGNEENMRCSFENGFNAHVVKSSIATDHTDFFMKVKVKVFFRNRFDLLENFQFEIIKYEGDLKTNYQN